MNGEHSCRRRMSDRPSSQAVTSLCRFDLENSGTTEATGNCFNATPRPLSNLGKVLAKYASRLIKFTEHGSKLTHRQRYKKGLTSNRRKSFQTDNQLWEET